MNINFDKIFSSKKEMEGIDRSNPYNVMAMLIHTLCNYNPNNTNNFYEMLGYLVGEYQPISSIMKQNIMDRMLQNDKFDYIGKSYFKGANFENDYSPSDYSIDIEENKTLKLDDGYVRLSVKSGGSDSDRVVTLRLARDGNYYIWGDSFIGLLSDIRHPMSTDPWR